MPAILQDLSSKSEESEGEEGRKGGREEKEDRNQLNYQVLDTTEIVFQTTASCSCFADSTKLQINAVKNTCNQTSSDKAPFNYVLKIILNKKSKI